MKSLKRRNELYLRDMLNSMKRIEEYIGDSVYAEFENNFMLVDAVVRNFEIIGEAARKVTKEIQQKYPEMPWQKMYGLRNLVIHEYFGIDHEMIWEIAKNHLPQNKHDLERIILEQRGKV
jgi:uncharacterized protein with HEPN domain